MKTTFFFLAFALSTLSAFATEYKCYSSKYPEGMNHFFEDGYVKLSIKNGTVNLKYFDKYWSADKKGALIDADYELGKIVENSRKVSGMRIGRISKENRKFPGDEILYIYFDESLVVGAPGKSGIVGKFAFQGANYAYDWNVCYNVK